LPAPACPHHHPPPPTQITYDRYGVYLTVSNLCVGAATTTFGKAMIYAFDKDAIHGYRALKARRGP
jgi:hypothetical protein